MKTIVQSIYYNQASDTLKHDIAALLHQIWPENSPMPRTTIPEAHDKKLNARSFYSYIDGKLISYVGVVRKTIQHDGQTYNIAGLSCLATDPKYRGQGLGLRTVAAATKWIEKQRDIDFGIFTCRPSLASFYNQSGSWPVVPDVVLIGNMNEGALSSESLNLVVLMRLFSEKAKANESTLRHSAINLEFPDGEFL